MLSDSGEKYFINLYSKTSLVDVRCGGNIQLFNIDHCPFKTTTTLNCNLIVYRYYFSLNCDKTFHENIYIVFSTVLKLFVILELSLKAEKVEILTRIKSRRCTPFCLSMHAVDTKRNCQRRLVSLKELYVKRAKLNCVLKATESMCIWSENMNGIDTKVSNILATNLIL